MPTLLRTARLSSAAMLLACGGGDSPSAPGTPPDTQFPLTAEVTMPPGDVFVPFLVDIRRGGTVRYVFPQRAHNVIFANVPGAPPSIGITSNQTVSRTFNTAGTFDYTCTLHPGMDGRVVVH